MIVITGAAGFIGRNLAAQLQNHSLLLVDFEEYQERCSDLDYDGFYDYDHFLHNIETDSTFRNFVKDNVEVIFHQGACSDTTNYDVEHMMYHNFDYSRRLFDFARSNNIQFIYASSAATYGHGLRGFLEDRGCETPLNIYARSKHTFDEYVRCFINTEGPQVVGIRYFNVYGPGENDKGKMASVVQQFYRQYQETKRIKLFEGSETFFRDFIYITDIVKINKFFMKNPQISGIYNGGTGTTKAFSTIAEIFNQRYSDLTVDVVDFPESLRKKYQMHTEADISKLLAEGYTPDFVSLETGVNRYLDFLEHDESSLC